MKQQKIMQADKKRRSRKRFSVWFVTIFVITIAVIIVFFNALTFVKSVPDNYMANAINQGESVIVNRASYWFRQPGRLETVLYMNPDSAGPVSISRVVGLPGETVEIKAGVVYIDGLILDDKRFINGQPTGDFGPFTVPARMYFLLGDNRNESVDSKNWKNAYVSEDNILGEVFMRYRPGIALLN